MCAKARTLAGISILLTVALLISCSASVSTGGGGVVVQFTIGGRTFRITFGEAGVFDLVGGEPPVQQPMVVTLFEETPTDQPAGVSFRIEPADVEFLPRTQAAEKGTVRSADGPSEEPVLLFTIYIADRNEPDPCANGYPVVQFERRGTEDDARYFVDGEETEAIDILTSTVQVLSVATRGVFSLCYEISSNVDGRATIRGFTMTFGDSGGTDGNANDNTTPDDNVNDNEDVTPTDAGQVVVFPDPCLEDAVRTAINLPTNDITAGDLLDLTSLSANRVGLSNLSGLEYCTGLEYLDLIDNDIEDLRPLDGLPNLKQLHLGNNLIVDISPLADLPALEVLTLTANQVSNIGPLQWITSLLSLNVSYQLDMRIPEGVEAQQPPGFVYADHTILSDVSPVDGLTRLTELRLSGNKISDISPLDSLTELRTLAITNNQITDLTPLRELPDLGTVFLNQNPLTDLRPLADNLSLGEGTTLYLNCCSPGFDCNFGTAPDPTQCGYIADLEARGVTVNAGYSDAETCAQMPPILGLGSGTCDLQ